MTNDHNCLHELSFPDITACTGSTSTEESCIGSSLKLEPANQSVYQVVTESSCSHPNQFE